MGAQLATEQAGAVLGGRYRVEGALGHGGMGVVYRARDLATGGVVAVKVLDPRTGSAPSTVDQRFAREIAAVQKLESSHAVRLIDAGTLGDGRHFMAMEHLEGTDLHHLLDGLGRLPIQRAVRLIRQACAALTEAHALGIVHRDLKPANLFVTWLPDGSEHLKVLDFGISKLPQASMEELALTVTGAVLGSPVYMSPEQMSCSRDVDGRTDIWALGVVLYQCLSGGFPYQADAMPQLCARVLTDDPIPLSAQAAVPPGLEAVVMRCLARDPDQRFARIEDLAAALLPFAGEAGAAAATIVIRPQRFAMPSPPPAARHTPMPAPRAEPPEPARFVEPEPDAGHHSRLIYLAGAAVGLIAGIIYMLAG
jgi:eukaryotic-like serine/threonine-protein kinase